MFPQGGATESPKDQVMILVVPGVLGGHVPEEMVICHQDVFRPIPYLPPYSYYDPRPSVVGPGNLAHRWDLPVLHYHKIMIIYPYPFLVVITLLFS